LTVGGLGATPVGTPSQVANEFERWVNEADVDGFNIVSFDTPASMPSTDLIEQAYAITPGSFNDVIELLIPELRKRGIFWNDYVVPSGTYRENLRGEEGQISLPVDHPAYGYRWKAEPK
jgi:hypothetical protein